MGKSGLLGKIGEGDFIYRVTLIIYYIFLVCINCLLANLGVVYLVQRNIERVAGIMRLLLLSQANPYAGGGTVCFQGVYLGTKKLGGYPRFHAPWSSGNYC